MDVYKPVYPGLYYFDTFTFTTLGTSGHRGPESTKTYANAPWRDGDFSIVGGQQQWTVPATGTYRIEAAGAYGATPGRVVSGDVDLNEGQVVSLLVGQQPTPLTANVADATTVGGGGGTFIGSIGTLLMVASGGDGTGGSAASFSPYGTGDGKNGGGYLSNGLVTSVTFKFLKPEAYVDGGFGNSFPTGVVPEEGGFGGGQSPVTSGISGGGGYTGSAGDGVSGATCYADPAVRNFTDLGASGNTAGTVTISLIDPAPVKQITTLNPWSIQPTAFAPTTTWSAVAYGNGVYVSVSDNGTFPVMYSTNGLDWLTNTTGAIVSPWKSVTFGNGKFVAVGNDCEMYSLDGIIWFNSYSLLYENNGSINVGGFNGWTNRIAMNSDGTVIASSAYFYNRDNSLVFIQDVYKNNILIYSFTLPTDVPTDILCVDMAMNSNGSIIAVGSLNFNGYNRAYVYTNGILTYDLEIPGVPIGYGGRVVISSDGTIVAVGGYTENDIPVIYVYTNGVLTDTLEGGPYVAMSSDGSVIHSNVNPIVTNSDGTITAIGLYNSEIQVYNNQDLMYTIYTGFTDTTFGFPSSQTPFSMNAGGTLIAVGHSYPEYTIKLYNNGFLSFTIPKFSYSIFGTVARLNSEGTIVACTASTYGGINPLLSYKIVSYPIASQWSSVSYGNGTFVAVAKPGGSMSSPDGIYWSQGDSLNDTWSATTFGSNKFIAVSNYGSTSNVMYSLDGNVWSNVTTGTTSNSWTSLSYGNGRFTVVSSNATSMYSLNGIDWMTGGSPGVSSNCLTYGAGYFACPSSNSEVSAVSISTDGQTWQTIPLTYTGAAYPGITYGDSGIVAVSSTGLLLGFVPTFWVSPTQVANSSKLNSKNWSGLTYGNGSFVAVGQGLIQTTQDYGNTWSAFTVSNTLASVTYSSDLGTFVSLPGFFDDGVYTSTDGSTWTLSQTLPSVPSAQTSVAYGDGKFVALLNGDSNVFYSRDGINWSVSTLSGSDPWSSVTYGNGKFAAVSDNSNYPLMYSSDGLSWTKIEDPSYVLNILFRKVATNSDGTILVGSGEEGVYTYTNGVLTNFFEVIFPDLLCISSDATVIAVESQYTTIYVYNNGVLMYSVPGTGMTEGTPFALSADGTVLAVGHESENSVSVYTNGILTNTLTPGIIKFGTAVALSADGTVLAVLAGSRTNQGEPTSDNLVNVYMDGNLTYSIQVAGIGSIALSADGTVLAIGEWGVSVFGTVKIYKNGLLTNTITGDNVNFGYQVWMSADGTTVSVSNFSNGNKYYVYKNGILSRSFENYSTMTLSGDGTVIYLSDESEQVIFHNTELLYKSGWSSVTYGNGLFVAVANPGGSLYSSDGTNWFAGNAPLDNWASVSYGDGYFVAVSDNGTYPVMYSQDGINWSTTDPGSQFNNWGSVAFGGDTFLAIPTSGATTMTAQVTKTF